MTSTAAIAYFLLLGGITLAVLCALTALLERALNDYFAARAHYTPRDPGKDWD